MARKAKLDALARERKRRSQHDAPPSTHAPSAAATMRRAAAKRCGWCGGAIDLKATGRIPKWCSPACRQRAWEQTRAASSGRSAVEVVERVVEVPPERDRVPRPDQWLALLHELGHELDAGRIYARDLPKLGAALDEVAAAYERRHRARRAGR